MADHVRTQIRDAAVDLLDALTTTSTRCTGGRPKSRPVQESELPCLLVYTNETEAEPVSGTMGARRMAEVCQLVVHGFAQGTGDIDKTLDTIEKEVRVALAAAPTLSGLAKDSYFVGSTKESDQEAQQPTWEIVITFTVEYSTRETAPDAALA
jgi:RsiW-degrading membrane proteinase PrsW (M82 family)